jgi:hypothetical protein
MATTFLAGPYDVYYGDQGGVDFSALLNTLGTMTKLGTTEEGIELEAPRGYETIRGDNLGDVIQDRLRRRVDVFASCILEEYYQAVRTALNWPERRLLDANDTINTGNNVVAEGDLGFIPTLDPPAHKACTLILQPIGGAGITTVAAPGVTNPPYIALGHGTTTYPLIMAQRAVLAEDYAIREALNSRLKKFPMRWRLMPYLRTASPVDTYSFYEKFTT